MRRLIPALILTSLVAACAGEDGRAGEAGPPGAACSVTATGATATITCADGTSTTIDPGACTVASNGDGTHSITCPSGTIVVADGEQLERGTITGSAFLFGLPPVAGIEVTVQEVDRTATTDADGSFAIDGLPPGLYRLHLRHGGYAVAEVHNVVVFGGRSDVGTQTLKHAQRVASGLVVPTLAPGGTHAALLRQSLGFAAGDLALLDMTTFEATPLADGVAEPRFVDDRFLVAVRQATLVKHEAMIHDLGTGETRWELTDSLVSFVDGIFLSSAGSHRFLRLPGYETVELGGRPDRFAWDDAIVLLAGDGASSVGVFDVAGGTVEWFAPSNWSSYAFSEATGRLAFASVEDGVERLSVHHPFTGTRRVSTLASPLTQLAWCP